MALEVFARGRDRRVLSSVDMWTEVQMVLRYNDVSSWQVTVPATPAARYLAQAGNGVLIRRDGLTLLSGPTITYTEQWGESDQGDGTLVITGRDDLIDLTRALTEPDPLNAGTPVVAYDRITGPAETVIRAYVDRNIGAVSLPGRTRHRMGQTADLAAGPTVTGNARYDVLMDLVKALATAGGLGFRAIQDAGGIAPLFDVFTPTDRSDSVVFSKTGGSLAGYSYTISAPTATRVVVAGQGEGVARDVVQVTAPAAEEDWDAVVAVFADRRDTSDNDDYLQEAATTLVDGGATAGLSVTPIDLPGMRFGSDYYLGDVVSVDIDASTRITDVLTSVAVQAKGDSGEIIAPVIGAGELGETPALFRALRGLGRRIGLLEKRV